MKTHAYPMNADELDPSLQAARDERYRRILRAMGFEPGPGLTHSDPKVLALTSSICVRFQVDLRSPTRDVVTTCVDVFRHPRSFLKEWGPSDTFDATADEWRQFWRELAGRMEAILRAELQRAPG